MLNSARQDAIEAQASDWFLRLHDPAVSVAEIDAWQKWLGEHADHPSAFSKVERAWDRLSALPTPDPATATDLQRDTYDGSVPVEEWLQTRAHTPNSAVKRPRSLRWPIALAAVSLASAAALVFLLAPFYPAERMVLETPVGISGSFTLRDGSHVDLAGNTRIEVSLQRDRRQLSLMFGSANFSVAKDPRRPFTVRTRDTDVRALGTEFTVNRYSDRVVVSVFDGSVLVRDTHNRSPVVAGQRVTVDSGGIKAPVSLADHSGISGWRKGQLAFEGEPLRYVIEDINRYSSKRIVVPSASIAERKITGTVSESNIDGWVSGLGSALGVAVDDNGARITLSPERR